MPKFNPVRIDAAQPSTSDVNRIQNEVSRVFDTTASKEPTVTGPVTGTYKATDADQYIVVNSNAGPAMIVLPIPGLAQLVTVKNGNDTKNAVTVQRSDGKAIDGAGSVTVPALGSAMFLCDKKTWYQL
jgi:hypothetical protein